MKALKALVIFMGVLIVAGIGLVIYGLLTQFGERPEPVAAGPAAPPALAPPSGAGRAPAVGSREAPDVVPSAPFGDVVLTQPANTRIVEATVGEGRILLRLSGGGKPDRVAVLKADDGSLLGTISLGAGAVGAAGAAAGR